MRGRGGFFKRFLKGDKNKNQGDKNKKEKDADFFYRGMINGRFSKIMRAHERSLEHSPHKNPEEGDRLL